MEKINARKAWGDKEGDGAREELWKKRNFHGGREKRETEADEQVDEGRSSRDTSDEECEGETNGRSGPLIM